LKAHIIRQGEHLARLAHRYGFDAAEVWQHDRNRELRELRRSPEILAPGDVIYYPERPARGQPVSAGGTHRFQSSGRVPVRLIVRRGAGIVRDQPCEFVGISIPAARTDGDGRLSFEVPHHVEEVRLRFPALDFELLLRIGHLDPIEMPSGVLARLENLGFLFALGDVSGPLYAHLRTPAAEQRRIARALAAFQHSRALPVTGQLDTATRGALLEAHGG
jgi:hypothetical protein